MAQYTLTDKQLAYLSDESYKGEMEGKVSSKEARLSLIDNNKHATSYFVHAAKSDKATDFQAYLLEKAVNGKHTGEFVTVFRGSESAKDWQGNFQVLDSGHHLQEKMVKTFAAEAQTKAKEIAQANKTSYSMTNTGHSLGGASASLAHLVNGGKVVTFNPLNPYVFNEFKNNPQKINEKMFTHNIMVLDVASAVERKLPGEVNRYMRDFDLVNLMRHGYGSKNPLKDDPEGVLVSDLFPNFAHSSKNFVGKGSVLNNPEYRKNAERHKAIADEWRNDVAELSPQMKKKAYKFLEAVAGQVDEFQQTRQQTRQQNQEKVFESPNMSIPPNVWDKLFRSSENNTEKDFELAEAGRQRALTSQPLAKNATTAEYIDYTFAALLNDNDKERYAAVNSALQSNVARETEQENREILAEYEREQAMVMAQSRGPVRSL